MPVALKAPSRLGSGSSECHLADPVTPRHAHWDDRWASQNHPVCLEETGFLLCLTQQAAPPSTELLMPECGVTTSWPFCLQNVLDSIHFSPSQLLLST